MSNNNNNASVPNIATATLKIPHGPTMAFIIIVFVETILILAFAFTLVKWCLTKPALTHQPQNEVEKTTSPLQKLDVPKLEIVLPEPINMNEDKRPDLNRDASSTLGESEHSPNKAREGLLCGFPSSCGLLISHLIF